MLNIKDFSCFQPLLSNAVFILLISVKMLTLVGIFNNYEHDKFMLSGIEHDNSFITPGPGLLAQFQVKCMFLSSSKILLKNLYSPKCKFRFVSCQ